MLDRKITLELTEYEARALHAICDAQVQAMEEAFPKLKDEKALAQLKKKASIESVKGDKLPISEFQHHVRSWKMICALRDKLAMNGFSGGKA